MIGFDGRLRWRQENLFKLCAKPPQRQLLIIFNILGRPPEVLTAADSHSKFAIRLFLVRRTRNKQCSEH
jgi:hypothetical protein